MVVLILCIKIAIIVKLLTYSNENTQDLLYIFIAHNSPVPTIHPQETLNLLITNSINVTQIRGHYYLQSDEPLEQQDFSVMPETEVKIIRSVDVSFQSPRV